MSIGVGVDGTFDVDMALQHDCAVDVYGMPILIEYWPDLIEYTPLLIAYVAFLTCGTRCRRLQQRANTSVL